MLSYAGSEFHNLFQEETRMYIFTNALKNIMRNRGRNILLASIIFVIIATTVVTLMINNTSDRIINEYKNQFGVEVTISRNMPKRFAADQRG
jgi:putative ABC transport system permease protein